MHRQTATPWMCARARSRAAADSKLLSRCLAAQIWCIDWTSPTAGVQPHGVAPHATKSAYLARLNKNHWGVLYKKDGFQIVFDGNSRQQAEQVALAVGKQFKGSPITEAQQMEVRHISDEEAKPDGEIKEQPDGGPKEAKPDGEIKEQPGSEIKEAKPDGEPKEQPDGGPQEQPDGGPKEQPDDERKEADLEPQPPDSVHDTSKDHTECGDPVLIFIDNAYTFGCEKCMLTWATGNNTRAQQRGADLDFEFNDNAQQWLKDAGGGINNRRAIEEIREAISQIKSADEKSWEREFKWTARGKTQVYGFEPMPKHLWIYRATPGLY